MTVEMVAMIHRFSINDSYFIFDTNSGALVEISETCYRLLEGIENQQFDFNKHGDFRTFLLNNKDDLSVSETEKDLVTSIRELEYLNEQGIIFSDMKLDEGDTYFHNNGVKALCIHPVHDCNMRCSYCFAHGGSYNQETHYMDWETGKQTVDFLIEQSGERRNLEIDFFGGEPLMNFSLIRKIVNYANQKSSETNKQFKFTITTNGLSLTEDIMDFLVDNKFAVVLSLDGRPEIHDSYRKDLAGNGTYDRIRPKFKNIINKMSEAGYQEYYIRGTYTRGNLDFARDVLSLAYEGFKRISLEPVTNAPEFPDQIVSNDLSKIRQEYTKLVETHINRCQRGEQPNFNFFHFNVDLETGPCTQKKITGCGAGFDYLAVDPRGDIYPCHQFIDMENYLMGNINSPEAFRTDISERLQSINLITKNGCQKCWAKFLCGGGCHANALNANGSLYEPGELDCELKKMQFEHALYKKAHENNEH